MNFFRFVVVMILIFVGLDSVAKKKDTVTRVDPKNPNRKIIYQQNTTIDFDGLALEGELKTPGEFYFQNREQERFDQLTKRRTQFHRELLRDAVQSQ